MQNLAVQKKTFLLVFVCFLGLFTFTFSTTILELWVRWNKFDESYSHGILVLGISVYYLFCQFKSLPSLSINIAWLGLVLMFGASVLWLLAFYASIEAIQQLLLPWLIWLFFYTLLGWNTAKSTIFPIAFLYFAIPFWDALTVPLQYITTDVNGILLSLAGVTAHIEDVFVTLPVGKFEIAGGCSGLRYLLISITLTSLYSYLNYTRVKSSLVLIASGILMALMANWIRVFIIILAGNATNMEHSLVNEHDHFGWLVFAITLIPLFFLAHKLERDNDQIIENKFEESINGETQINQSSSSIKLVIFIIITFIAAFAAPSYAKFSAIGTNKAMTVVNLKINTSLDNWKRSYLKNNLISPPLFQSPDTTFDGIYSDGLNDIQLSIRSYVQQAPGKELINFNNHLFNKDQFITTSSGQLVTNHNDFGYLILKDKIGKRELVSYQYLVSYKATSSRVGAKLLEVIRPLLGSPESTLIYTKTKCSNDCTAEKKVVAEFLNASYSQITPPY